MRTPRFVDRWVGSVRRKVEAVMNAGSGPEAPWALPRDMSGRAARDLYFRQNGFRSDAYEQPRTGQSVFGFEFSIPTNRWGHPRHDMHHVLTGFGTDLVGEGEVSAWEARHGMRGMFDRSAPGTRTSSVMDRLYMATLIVTGVAVGLVVAPRRTVQAYRRAGDSRPLFIDDTPYEKLLEEDVASLRAKIGVPPEGLATVRRLHDNAPQADAT